MIHAETQPRRTLFEIGADILALDQLLDETGGEVDPQVEAALDALMTELVMDEEAKLDGWVHWKKQLEMEQSAAVAEMDQWSKTAKSLENRILWLKSVLKRHLEGTNRKSVKTAKGVTIRVQANSAAPVVYSDSIDMNAVPDEFKRVRVELDREAVAKALKDGRKLDFASLGERGTHLRVA